MAYLTDIERLNYYEGEFLGALDFAAEQDYHRDMRRRHNVGQHTWGIVSGLDLAQVPNGQTSGAFTEVDVYVQPGMAVDAFGREILVLSRTQLTQDLFAAFFDPNPKAVARTMYIWIAFQQEFAQASTDVCASQNTANPYARIQESFRLLVTSTSPPTPALDDPLVIDGTQMTPPDEPASPPSPAPAPTPGEIVLPYDGSVPYQEFAEDDTTANWYVPLGQVLWDPHNQVFYQTGSSTAGRQFVGAVAAAIEAPDAQLLIQDRATPWPLPADPTYPGVAVEIGGSLTVDRLLTAEDDVYLIEPGHLYFKDNTGSDGDTPLWIRRFSNTPGGADLHIHIGDNSDPVNKPQRLSVASGPTGDESKDQILFDVRADGNVDIPVAALNFASQTRQMINLWGTQYGIGVQSSTAYFRSDADFCWFRKGTHSDNRSDPGSSGVLAMKLDDSSRLTVSGDVIVDGNLGIGTSTPGLMLDVKGDFGRDDGPIQLHLWGSRVGDVGNGILFLRSGGSVVAFDGGDNVGVGTTTPGYLLDVADRARIRQGASGTAGLFFYQTGPALDQAFVGMASDDLVGFWGSGCGWGTVMDITSGNVGIGTTTPTKRLSVAGSIAVTGQIGTNGFDPDSGYPAGWAGGIHTWDVYAQGSISSPHKYFVIDHPLDPQHKHLVHSTLEGPESAVFYRGQGQLSKGKATIVLPPYFEALTRKEDRTVQLTPKYAANTPIGSMAASDVHDGKFTVHAVDHGDSAQEFFWEVKAVRADVQPLEFELAKTPGKSAKAQPARARAAHG